MRIPWWCLKYVNFAESLLHRLLTNKVRDTDPAEKINKVKSLKTVGKELRVSQYLALQLESKRTDLTRKIFFR